MAVTSCRKDSYAERKTLASQGKTDILAEQGRKSLQWAGRMTLVQPVGGESPRHFLLAIFMEIDTRKAPFGIERRGEYQLQTDY